MTDDDLTPEQQEVRRLLAAARHDEPVPEPVAARLDRVLEGLAQEAVREAPVTDLATRRRRATSLLVAAAAVVAVGVGVSQVVDRGPNSPESQSAADQSVQESEVREDADTSDREREPTSSDAESQAGDGAAAPDESQEGNARSVREFFTLTRKGYSGGVSALRDQAVTTDGLTGAFKSELSASSAAGVTCLSDTWGEGTFVPVRYSGRPAVLVFRRPSGDTQVADLFLCGDTEPRRSVTLPAP